MGQMGTYTETGSSRPTHREPCGATQDDMSPHTRSLDIFASFEHRFLGYSGDLGITALQPKAYLGSVWSLVA